MVDLHCKRHNHCYRKYFEQLVLTHSTVAYRENHTGADGHITISPFKFAILKFTYLTLKPSYLQHILNKFIKLENTTALTANYRASSASPPSTLPLLPKQIHSTDQKCYHRNKNLTASLKQTLITIIFNSDIKASIWSWTTYLIL